MAQIIIDGEDIQWHLPYTTHDRCPTCKVRPLGNLGNHGRACMGTCIGGKVWELKASVHTWLEGIGFDRDEIALITRHGKPGGPTVPGLKKWARVPEIVRPGFLAELRRTNPSAFMSTEAC